MRSRDTHRFAALLAACAAMAAAAAVFLAATAAASPSCRVLSTSQIPVAKLEASYRKLTGLPPKTALAGSQPRRYGVCGSTHYAFELFTVAKGAAKSLTEKQLIAQQDHSAVWMQKRNGQWVDEGLRSLCKLAPAKLIDLWKVGVKC